MHFEAVVILRYVKSSLCCGEITLLEFYGIKEIKLGE